MRFKGLFVGIDRHLSPNINQLSCARRDALALHALFTDTFGGESTLLVDEEATAETMQRELERLTSCDASDSVVIAFSGHGTPTHELVPYDADTTNVQGTTISLDHLVELFKRISARRLLLILDCCFSGGMGAKVLTAAPMPRDIRSVESKLEKTRRRGANHPDRRGSDPGGL
jgi:helicase